MMNFQDSPTRYARDGDVHVAYRVTGAKPPDVLFMPDGLIPIDAMAEQSSLAHFLARLSTFARVIRFDRRGLGLSDPVSPTSPPSLEQWADDGRSVLAAAGSTSVSLLAMAEGGFVGLMLAATCPDLVATLVLVNATPCIAQPPFAEWGVAARALSRLERSIDEDWGTGTWGADAEVFAPSMAGNPEYLSWLERAMRRAASPAVMQAIFDICFRCDMRTILPAVRVPTLVIHRAGNRHLTPEHGRYLAQHIPDARYVEVPGADHVPYLGDAEPILDEIEEFITGARGERAPDRVLATILFTDIVASTEYASRLGDRAWRTLLDTHDSLVRRLLQRHHGREVKTTGDGFLATFDGPARAIQCGCAIRDGARQIGISVRVGIHTGECEVREDDIGGIAVHIAQRVQGAARADEVLVSSTLRDLVAGSGIRFADRGLHRLRGVENRWRLLAAES